MDCALVVIKKSMAGGSVPYDIVVDSEKKPMIYWDRYEHSGMILTGMGENMGILIGMLVYKAH